MKKFVVTTFIFFFTMVCFAQNDTINKFNTKGQKHGYWFKKENGTLVYEGRFNNDKPVGTFKYFYTDGKIKNISRFLKNGSVSYTTTYHPNGQISSIGKFIDKQRDSVWVYYNDAGKKISTESFKNGLPNGKWEKFDPKTEVLLDERYFLNGKKHGLWKTFYTTGQLRYEMVYVNDFACGPYKCYYVNGSRWHTGFYKDSFMDSIWVTYSNSGQMMKKWVFKNHKINENKIFAYTKNGSMPISIDSLAYLVANQNGVDFYLKDGKKIQANSEFTEIEDCLSDNNFILVSEIMLVSKRAIKKVTPEGKDAFLLELNPDFGVQIIVVGSYAESLRSFIDKSLPKQN